MKIQIKSKYDKHGTKYYFAENEKGEILSITYFSNHHSFYKDPIFCWQFANIKEIEKALETYKKSIEKEKIEKTLEI